MSIYDKASLVLIPSGTKTSKVYSQKPTNGDGDFTFSRSTAATRVNASGNIEKETQNLLTYSNTFSNAAWVKLGAGSGTAASVTSGFNDPDGGSNAWRLQCDLNGGSLTTDQSLIYQGGSLTGVFAFSYYVKSNTGASQDFAFGNSLNGYKLATATTSWQRFTTFHNCTPNNNSFIGARGGLNTDDTLDILIYAAQLEQGLVARDYIETTTTAIYGGITDNVPRLDYTDSSCPALLLEPQRTNKNPYSEYFGTFWNGLGTETITSNYGVSPEGLSNATRFQATSAGRGGMYASIAVNNGSTYTLSFYAKSLSGTQKIRIGADNGCVNPQGAETFEVTTEWQKFSKTLTSTQGGWNIFFDNIESGNLCTGTYLNCDMLVYGFQAEEGSYATSYIPTYGSAVTRNEDTNVNITGALNTIGQSEGTLLLDFNALEFENSSRYLSIESSSGAGSGWIGIFASSPDKFRFYGDGFDVNIGGYSAGDRTKIALTYKNGVATNIYINGTNKGSITANTTSKNYSILKLGYAVIGGIGAGRFNEVLIFPTALTDQEAIDLTTI